ncbi:hypothetical protein U1Q18_019520 [Sarracenia purpurea var. burkii]
MYKKTRSNRTNLIRIKQTKSRSAISASTTMRRYGGVAGDSGKGGGGGTTFVVGEGTTTVVRVRAVWGWRTLGGAHGIVKETSEEKTKETANLTNLRAFLNFKIYRMIKTHK